MFHQLRPWGALEWVLPRVPDKQWSLLGTIATEDRCIATLKTIGSCDGRCRFLVIVDPDPLDEGALRERLRVRRKEFVSLGVPETNIAETQLFADLDSINGQLDNFFAVASSDVILDISTMPKRWFFPILKLLTQNEQVKNLVVTYSSPIQYAEVLSENPDPIRMFPGFAGSGTTEYDSVVVGIGFEPLGIPSLFTELGISKIRLMFPFPPGPPAFLRNWMFVKLIEEMTDTQEIETPDRVSIHLFDSPQVFDALRQMTDSGSRSAVLAPYGPKPMSLAMCLFSLAASRAGRPAVPVYYSQPRRYSADYSTGIRGTHAYCVKLAGKNLYSV